MKILKPISFLFLLTLTAFIYYGCGCSCGTAASEANIPLDVLKNANEVITVKTGKEFFDKYITIDLQRSKEMPPDYFLVYRMIMPDKPYVNETIELTVDSKGNLNTNFSVKGIPDCAGGDCDFPIDEKKAIDAAIQSGLDKGIKDWQSAFTWSDKYNKYVWHVLSTLSESESSNGKRSSGKEVIVDGNTGEVLEQKEWHVR